MLRGIGVLAVVLNIVFLCTIFLVERYYARVGRIRPRVPYGHSGTDAIFPYMADYRMVAIGDSLGLSLIDFGVAVLAGEGYFINGGVVTTVIILSALATAFVNSLWLSPLHRPNSTYPSVGKINLVGLLHLVYFFLQAGIAMIALYALLTRAAQGLPALAALLGGIIYGSAFLSDMRAGRL